LFNNSFNQEKGKLPTLIVLTLLLAALSGCYGRLSPVVRNIHLSVENGDTVFLGDFTNFVWDNVIIANPGTSNRDILLFLGDRGRVNMDFDIQVVVIFRKGERVVHFIDIHGSLIDATLLNFV